MKLFASIAVVITTSLLLGCGSDSSSTDNAQPHGTAVLFDLSAQLDSPEAFYDFPYPSDLRVDEQGHPKLAGFPISGHNKLIMPIRDAAMQHPGFPVLPVAYFRFSADLAEHDLTNVIPADVSSPVLLIDVDPSSSERGKLIPTVAKTLDPDGYVPEHMLAVAARPGFVLRGDHTYAFVVMRSFGDEAGAPLTVPPTLATLASGGVPDGALGQKAVEVYKPLWDTLSALDIPAEQVAAATVFTTGDVVKEMADISTGLKERDHVEIRNLRVDPDDGADHDRFCEILADVSYPQYQEGKPPFNEGGLFKFGDDGLPIEQRKEDAKVVITFNRTAMPKGGYPLAIYFHGSGGPTSSVVDRGTWHPEKDESQCPEFSFDEWEGVTGCHTKGEGPAFVLAPHGFGMASTALPVNPERLPGADDYAYLNFNNLSAFRDTFRQGVIEQRMFLDAVLKLKVDPKIVEACTGMSLPEGETAYHFSNERVVAQGQSMGGMYTNMVGAVEPRFEALVPTGAGGYWSYFILRTHLMKGINGKIALLLSAVGTKMTFVHPAMHVFETAVEAADPIVYMPRLARRPLPGNPVRPVYEPVGKGDSYFPMEVYDAIVLAYGHREAGEQVWTTMQDSLKLAKLDGLLAYPVKDDVSSDDGEKYTGVVVQYPGDGVYDPHGLYSQMDEVKYQYGCFLETFRKTGEALVLEPKPLGTPCQ